MGWDLGVNLKENYELVVVGEFCNKFIFFFVSLSVLDVNYLLGVF